MHITNPWSSLHSLMLNHLSQDDSRLIGINYIFEMSDDKFLKKIGQKLFIRWHPVFYNNRTTTGSGCSTVVEHTPHDREVVGSNPDAQCTPTLTFMVHSQPSCCSQSVDIIYPRPARPWTEHLRQDAGQHPPSDGRAPRQLHLHGREDHLRRLLSLLQPQQERIRAQHLEGMALLSAAIGQRPRNYPSCCSFPFLSFPH